METENAAACHFHQHEDVENAKLGRHYDKAVAYYDPCGVIVNESGQALLRVWCVRQATPAQILRYLLKGNQDSRFQL